MTTQKTKPSAEELALELKQTKQKLAEAEETIRAISEGEVDAIVKQGVVFTLEGAEHSYRVIVETMNEAAVMTTNDGTILFANSRFNQLIGRKQEEVIGRQLDEFVSSSDIPVLKKLLISTPLKRRLMLLTKSKHEVPVYVSSNKFGPDIEGVCLVLTDLTALEAASERLRRVEQQLYEIVDNTDIILWACDKEGTITLSEGRGLQFEGLAPGQIVGKNVAEINPNDPVKDYVQKALGGKDFSFTLHSPHGRFYDTRITPTRDTKTKEITGIMGISLDVTEKIKAAEEIETLALIPSENPNPVIRCDTQGKILYANIVSKQMNPEWNIETGQVLPNDINKIVKKALKAGKTITEDLETGEKMYFIYAYPVKERNYVNLYGRDITAEKKAERALRESEQRLKILFNYAPDPYILLDSKGRLVDSNHASDNLDGRPKEVLEGKNLFEAGVYKPGDDKKAYELFKRSLRGEPTGPDLLTILHVDGHEIIIELFAYPVEIKGEMHVLCAGRDVTQRVLDERELQIKTAQLEQFYDNTHILIALLDKDYNFVRVNKAYAARENKTIEWFEGKNHFTIYPNLENEAIFKRVLDTSKPFYAYAKPYVYPTKPETTTYWDWSLQPIMGTDGKVQGLILCLIDATEEQAAIKALERSRQQMRALAARVEFAREEERTLISREIHDELGQILTGLRMDIAWLEQKSKSIKDAKLAELFIKKLDQMTKTLFITLETARKISRSLRPSVLDDLGLTAAIEWQTEEFQARSGIKCELDIQPMENVDRPAATALFRILQEALTNVARHAKATEVKVKLKKQNNELVLEVKDNGRGITENNLKNTESLGIVGMRERAFALGGEIQITNTGKGTLVKVIIPGSGGDEK